MPAPPRSSEQRALRPAAGARAALTRAGRHHGAAQRALGFADVRRSVTSLNQLVITALIQAWPDAPRPPRLPMRRAAG